jgi:hypothetical protein
MVLKSAILKPFAQRITKKMEFWINHPVEVQHSVLKSLIEKGRQTVFGKEHGFETIRNYEDYRKIVPVRDYEELKPFIDRILDGEKQVLWPGKPLYLSKTSGTTSGIKYIPISKESMPHHIDAVRNMLFNYFITTGHGDFFNGKMLYLSGSPVLGRINGIPTGRLSGIVNHQLPFWIKSNRLPSFKVNCEEAWEEKVDLMVEECINKDVRLIGGIPPWVQMFYEKLLERSGKADVLSVFPNLSMFVYGGVNYEPYRKSMEHLTGGSLASLETFPASEGFFAFQDRHPHEGLLLNVQAGIFYEFIPAEDIFSKDPHRISLKDVEEGKNYAMVVSTNAGLWAYNIGDTIEFVSKNPYRLKVTGRVKHFISAFGEHVIGKEVETAMNHALSAYQASIVEFTVAPQVNPHGKKLPFHEWYIEFEKPPSDLESFARLLDHEMVSQNIYYKDLISGKILQSLVVRPLGKGAFRKYMYSIGKLGGQNKVPRLSNDRHIANALDQYILEDRIN